MVPAEARLNDDFATFAHVHQEHVAAGNNGEPWTTWLMLGGRGAGKTRAGAEWVKAMVHGTSPYADRPHGFIALLGETEHDVREIMVEGPSGILQTALPDQRPTWISTRRRLEWPFARVSLKLEWAVGRVGCCAFLPHLMNTFCERRLF